MDPSSEPNRPRADRNSIGKKHSNQVLLCAKKGFGNEFSCSIEAEKLSFPHAVKKLKEKLLGMGILTDADAI